MRSVRDEHQGEPEPTNDDVLESRWPIFPHLFESIQAFLVEELADSTDAALRSEQIQNPPEDKSLEVQGCEQARGR